MKRIYLDYAATTPVDPRVHEAMEPALGPLFGNPSSIHGFGQEALAAVENARETVALLLNASPEEVIFTSGGTESDNSAIWSACSKGGHIVTSAVEHHAVLHACQFMQIEGLSLTVVPVDKDGIVDPDDVERALTPKTVLVSVMHANNEIGTIQPIAEIRKRVRDKEIPFHTDAVQTFGHMPVDVKALHVDFLSLSAHKLCGPKGSGALYIRKGMHFIPLIHGGGQERNRRSSTHNVPGIVGLGKAVELARAEMVAEQKRIRTLRDRLYERIRKDLDGIRLNGHPTERLANNLNVSVRGVEGESLIMRLDMEGVAVSSGSACSSGSDEPSHVLLAIGLSKAEAQGSVRITLGRFTTEEEIDAAADRFVRTVRDLRALSS